MKVLAPESNEELWAANFPLRKVPCFLGPDNFKLNELIAVSFYLVELSDNEAEKKRLLGSTLRERAEVLQWLSLATQDLCLTFTKGAFPLNGRAPYNRKQVEDAYEELDRLVERYEARLRDHTYLVGERASLADYSGAIIFTRIFENLYGEQWRKQHHQLMRWFNTIVADPFVSFLWKDINLCKEPLKHPGQK